MNYSINKSIDGELMESLYNGSALTIEGLDLETIDDYAQYLDRECGGVKDGAVFHVITGKYMNNFYLLSGTNAYPDDLNIVAIKLDHLKNLGRITIKRFSFEGRWFDDIVDNNKMRQDDIDNGR